MKTANRPGIWPSEKTGIVARCNLSIQNQREKGRRERVPGWETAGKSPCGKDFRLY